MFLSNHKNKYNRGVTLIELMVVIVIFMILTGITIFSYGKFNSSLSIQNLADDIALSVRQAQGYAIGVRDNGSALFSSGYGVHLTANPSNIASPYLGSTKSFVLFADISDDKAYDQSTSTCKSISATNECLEFFSITTADQISAIYLNSSSSPIAATDTLDITFKRPNPEPAFKSCDINGNNCSSSTIASVQIKIISPNSPETYKVIKISNNGQISVSDKLE